MQWIQTHGVEAVIIYWLFAAAVSTMPEIPPTAGYWSRWAYGFLHFLGSNLKQFIQAVSPQTPIIKLPPDSNDADH